MHSDERRKAIADVLRAANAPVSASALAEKFSVSRQIIVGDIALLRSSGEEILATPRGYVTPKEARGILRRVVYTRHQTVLKRDAPAGLFKVVTTGIDRFLNVILVRHRHQLQALFLIGCMK